MHHEHFDHFLPKNDQDSGILVIFGEKMSKILTRNTGIFVIFDLKKGQNITTGEGDIVNN